MFNALALMLTRMTAKVAQPIRQSGEDAELIAAHNNDDRARAYARHTQIKRAMLPRCHGRSNKMTMHPTRSSPGRKMAHGRRSTAAALNELAAHRTLQKLSAIASKWSAMRLPAAIHSLKKMRFYGFRNARSDGRKYSLAPPS